MSEGTRHDLLLKRIQIIIAILASLATFIVGFYNVKKLIEGKKTGELIVTVYSENKAVLAGATIELSNAQNVLLETAITKSDGVYFRKKLEEGTYLVKAAAIGHETSIVSVAVKGKEVSDIKLSLRVIKKDQTPTSPIQSALEEVGASWLKTLTKPKEETTTQK